MPGDTENFLKNAISDLQSKFEIEFRKIDEKIIEIESSIDNSSSLEPLKSFNMFTQPPAIRFSIKS